MENLTTLYVRAGRPLSITNHSLLECFSQRSMSLHLLDRVGLYWAGSGTYAPLLPPRIPLSKSQTPFITCIKICFLHMAASSIL